MSLSWFISYQHNVLFLGDEGVCPLGNNALTLLQSFSKSP